jgi:hypothetical protein
VLERERKGAEERKKSAEKTKSVINQIIFLNLGIESIERWH